jgi:histidinol dehydrogenase
MPYDLSIDTDDFEQKLNIILTQNRAEKYDVTATVKSIIADVRMRGDTALLEYTQKFDNPNAVLSDLKISPDALIQAEKKCDEALKSALNHAMARIYDFHARLKPNHDYYQDVTGTYLGLRYTPVDAAGVYIPGGSASYPSSVLMNIIPAKVAGVGRIVAVVPAPLGIIHPAVLYALKIAGADEIYAVGGAQAIAALAYGTQMIKSVDKITGPGNAFVAESKRQVYGQVGIDSIAGPSEILIIADDTANPDFIAADLLSQAEHDAVAQSVLITPSQRLIDAVKMAVDKILPTLNRQKIAQQSWNDYGVMIKTNTIEQACEISDRFAPEHLEICTDNPELLLPFVRHAGAIFMGHYTPEAVGDYMAGPNHVLPTGRTARFSSGLSTVDFMKRTTLIHCSQDSFGKIAPDIQILCDAEGLDAHKLSISTRL